MLPSMEELRRHYLFTADDETNISRAGELILPFLDQFGVDFYDYLLTYPETAQFFRTPEAIQRRKETIKQWLVELLSGKHDNRYVHSLQHVARDHVKKGIPIHWVTAAMNFKREWLLHVLDREVEDPAEFRKLAGSLDKILDINLDVLSSTYHEEELRRKFLSARMDSAMIGFADRFTYGLNVILIIALMGLSLTIVGVFAVEIYRLFQTVSGFEQQAVGALGTLLIIWVMIELLKTEIKYLKGERFHVEVFISVALVSIIRELLIASLGRESIAQLGVMVAAILVLGVVYYMLTRTEVR